jgi:hypothetical protein
MIAAPQTVWEKVSTSRFELGIYTGKPPTVPQIPGLDLDPLSPSAHRPT